MPIKFLGWVEEPKKWDKRRFNQVTKQQKKTINAFHRKHWFVAAVPTPLDFILMQHTAIFPAGTNLEDPDIQPTHIHKRTRKAFITGKGEVKRWEILPLEIYDYTGEQENG